MATYLRSGKPYHVNGSSVGGTAAIDQEFPLRTESMQIEFANTHATEPIEVFFLQSAAQAGTGNGFTVSARTSLSLPIEAQSLWVRSTNNCTFQCVVAGRG